MSTLSQFMGGKLKPTSIINGHSTTIATPTANDGTTFPAQARQVLSGAWTVRRAKTILSITGKGALSFLAFHHNDSTSRASGIRLEIDGIAVFDAQTAAHTLTNNVYIVGSQNPVSSPVGIIEQPLFFDQSLVLKYTSGLTETDKATLAYLYYLR